MFHQSRFTLEKIERRLDLIAPLVYRRRVPLPPLRLLELDSPLDPVPLDQENHAWTPIEPYTYWGRQNLNFAIAGEFRVPPEFDHASQVALLLLLGESGDFSHPEALVYIDGTPYAAADRHHQEIQLPPQWRDGKEHRLLLHGWTGLLGRVDQERGRQLFARDSAVVQIDQPTRDFVINARIALGTAQTISPDDPAHDRLLNALDAAFGILDTREPFGDDFYASVKPAAEALAAGIGDAGAPLDVRIVATGHAHIDTAWLWTLGQTRRKAGRTFHTVLRLMEQFKDYHFVQSQPQLYDFVRQDYPALFEGIKQRIQEGRWEPIGGMWVEADCNITGGESLARQFLLGRTFFRQHFGAQAESRVLWLPDVFGYAWNLPQLIKLAGLDYFFTIKIGWNQYNHMPYDSFWWQGLDGTKVLTHFSTTPEERDIHSKATYNSNILPHTVLGTWLNLQQKAEQREILMSYGWGDGGGGPSREMLENGRALAHFPSMPQVEQGSVINFFRDLEAESGDQLPTWNGELYLELHRGTYTTQSRNKRANRQSEFLLHDAEFAATVASLIDATYHYPHETFQQAWELVCLNQFHDIIPGSSIGPVYVESQQQYAQIRALAEQARGDALQVIGHHIGGDLLAVNATHFTRYDLAFWPGSLQPGEYLRQLGVKHAVYTQATADGTWIGFRQGLNPLSASALVIEQGAAPTLPNDFTVTPTLLENLYIRVELNEAGDIVRIYDKECECEILPPGAIANQWQAFEDRPTSSDAWDVDIFYEDRFWTSDPATSVEVIEAGPLRATLEIQRRILHSDYVQRISLSYNSPRLDFDTTIHWQERHIFLKTAFPVDILSPTATYEVQWGNVQRPTHRNTSWDWARFETCAQKWVDLAEGGYGVGLINDCKYGHDIHDNVMRISLLRSPTSPDPEADQGDHRFGYALLPRDHINATVVNAYLFNDPILIQPTAQRATPDASDEIQRLALSLLTSYEKNVIVETIKRAEDGNGIIVRLYEFARRRGTVTLEIDFPLQAAYITNLLEENQEQLTPNGSTVSLFVKPFQIVTLRLIPEA